MKIYKLILILFIASTLFGQFGKNKVQYDKFSWKYIQSNHFEIYYYGDSKALAEFTAKEAEKAYLSIRDTFNWPLQRRYSIILYNSHNAFQQTNVVYSYMEEGIGGVTELYKNRVILPFEGSYQDFRHVIHHELVHAFMNDMYYGGSVQSLVSGAVKLQIPLWLAEGAAEFESLGWDANTDMFMRDFTFQSQFFPIEYLYGYYAYRGGQSVYRFIQDTYGLQKVTEFFSNLKSTYNVNKAILKTFNMNMEDFSKEWHKFLKKLYWPDIEHCDDVNRVAVRLTDHVKMKNSQNSAPAISPTGSKIAFLSDRDGYADIYIMDADDGENIERLVKGNRKSELEELKWLSPGISWSPDSKYIVFATKSGKYDALIYVDIESKEQTIIPIKDLLGVYSPSWHPSEDIIVFEGNNGTQSDLYTYNLKTKSLKRLMDDIQRDSNPSWSPDGRKIIYTRENKKKNTDDFKHVYQTDIYEIVLENEQITALTETENDEDFAQYLQDNENILYTSDATGILNIWRKDSFKEAYPITNVLGGIFHLDISKDGSSLIFTAFQNSGWDIYRLNSAVSLEAQTPYLTKFIKNREIESKHIEKNKFQTEEDSTLNMAAETNVEAASPYEESDGNYRNFVFLPQYKNHIMKATSKDTVKIDSSEFLTDKGDYIDTPYKTKFSLDLVDSQLGYSTFYGFQGYSVFLFSDVFGDHQFAISTELYIDLKNSDYSLSYSYLKERINYGVNYFNYSDYYYSYLGNFLAITQFRNYGFSGAASYPIDKFRRIDLNETYYTAQRSVVNDDYLAGIYDSKLSMLINTLSYVQDNVIWSYTAPMDGLRYRLSVDYVPKLSDDSPNFNTLTLDLRKYWKANFDYHFGLRFNAGTSWGGTPQTFMLGGVDNWINYKYNPNAPIFGNSTDSFSEDMELYYFSRFITPVRGTPYFAKSGHNFFVVNAELRYPFVEYMKVRFPIPFTLYQVRGVLFTDFGAAWYDNANIDLWAIDGGAFPFINNDYHNFLASSGYGLRIFLGYFLLRIDTAWEYDGHKFSKPRYLFSLGGDF